MIVKTADGKAMQIAAQNLSQHHIGWLNELSGFSWSTLMMKSRF
jgi:hypothetical protein